MRSTLTLLLTMFLWTCIAMGMLGPLAQRASAVEPIDTPALQVDFNADNTLLPDTIRLKAGDVELLASTLGLDQSFISFEFHKKIYHDESRQAWPGRDSPRFMTDAKYVASELAREGDYTGLAVDYSSSYADVQRTVLVHTSEPRLMIRYKLVMNRDVLVHESHLMAVNLRLNKGFNQRRVIDAREGHNGVILAEGFGNALYPASPLSPGPVMFVNPQANVAILVTSQVAGDLPDPVPAKLLEFKKGQVLILTLKLRVGPANDPAMLVTLKQWQAQMPKADLPYELVQQAAVLRQAKKLDEAEQVLLSAARLNKDYAVPYSQLAALRRDFKRPGQVQAWAEAGYRNIYNYGYMLSAIGLPGQAKLTEAQRRLHMFNLLIVSENTLFNTDYYVWTARRFEQMNMDVQACAMYRQALWAVDYMPRPKAYRQRYREKFQKKIAELEKKLLNHTAMNLPEPLPARAQE